MGLCEEVLIKFWLLEHFESIWRIQPRGNKSVGFALEGRECDCRPYFIFNITPSILDGCLGIAHDGVKNWKDKHPIAIQLDFFTKEEQLR